MQFEKKTWKDRITEYPTRRTLTKEDGSTELVMVARSEGNVSQEGDAFNALNMNDLEERIEAGFDDLQYTKTVNLSAAGWTASADHTGYYEQSVDCTEYTDDSTPVYALYPADGVIPTAAETSDFASVVAMVAASTGLTFYASEIPAGNLQIRVIGR